MNAPSPQYGAPLVKREYAKPEAPKPLDSQESLYNYFSKRGISQKTLARNKVVLGEAWSEAERRNVPVINFQYFRDGELVNIKHRALDKKAFRLTKDAERVLYGIDDIRDERKQIIITEGECFPPQVQVLTESGWVEFGSYQGQNVVQVDNNGKMSLAKPQFIVKKEYSGVLTRTYTNNGFDHICTPGHNMVSIDDLGNVTKHRADSPESSLSIPRSGLLSGAGIGLTEEQVEMCVYATYAQMIYDNGGYLSYKPNHADQRPAKASFTLNRPNKIAIISRIMKRLNIATHEDTDPSGLKRIMFDLPDWCTGKELPHEWVTRLSIRQKRAIISALTKWSGASSMSKSINIKTRNKNNAEFYQAIAHTSLMNSKTTLCPDGISIIYKMSISIRGAVATLWSGLRQESVPYEGDVHCVSVPSGMILVRHNGCVIVTGNCDKLALEEAGYINVVSVPDGAPPPNTRNVGTKLDYFNEVSSIFDNVEHITFAVDNDAPGDKLAEFMLTRFKRGKCSRVLWSEGCKDANDVLVKYGAEELRKCIDSAEHYPVTGLFDVRGEMDRVYDMYQNGLPRGFSTGFKNLDMMYRPLPGTLTIVTGSPSAGKALALDTILPTPDGWTTMGKVTVGTKLFDGQGNVCRVMGVTETWTDRPCYRLSTDDGESIVCDEDHEWPVTDSQGVSSIKTAGELSINPQEYAIYAGFSLTTDDKELPIHPYVLGVWLRCGKPHAGSIVTSDTCVVKRFEDHGYHVHSWKTIPAFYYSQRLQEEIKKIGIAGEPTIPKIYLRSSRTQRLALLKGLVDGAQDKEANVMCDGSVDLARSVVELVISLGLAGLGPKITRMIGGRYRVIIGQGGDTIFRRIRSCDRVESVPVRCIQVDSPSSLYLAGRTMIPTHNSHFLDNLVVKMAHVHDWRFAFYSPENYPLHYHISRLLAIRYGKPFDRSGPKGRLTPEELEDGLWWLHDHVGFIMPDQPNIEEILERAFAMRSRMGINGMILDPWNEIERSLEKGANETQYVSDVLSRLRQFARETDVHVWVVAHPTKLQKTSDGKYPIPTPYDISGSAHFYNKADQCLSVHREQSISDDPVGVHVQKMRFSNAGQRGTSFFSFDYQTGIFKPTSYTLANGKQETYNDDPEQTSF